MKKTCRQWKKHIKSVYKLPPPVYVFNDIDFKDDLHQYANYHTLKVCDIIGRYLDVSMLGNLHTLDCSNTSVLDVSMLGNLHTLDYSDTKINDVSRLVNLLILRCHNTDVVDVSTLIYVNFIVETHIYQM